jgi:chemotaxis protein CheC
MTNPIEFNEDERDCLQELMNVAYGSATASISAILNSFATLNIPKIKIISSSELKNYLNSLYIHDEQFVATQLLGGDLAGENLFILNTQSVINLAYEFDLEDEEINDDELLDIVLEVTNILSSSMIGKLAEELDTTVLFSPPSVQKINSLDDLDNKYLDEYQQIIIISTELLFEKQKISGELLLLTKDDSIIWMKSALNKILDEF